MTWLRPLPARLLQLIAAVALLLGVHAAVPGASAEDKKPTAAQRKDYLDQLKAGRKAAQAKDWPWAVIAYEAALKSVPGGASALGELGWAQFQLGKLDEAAKCTSAAIYASRRAKQTGALLYNQGRIQEAQNKLPDARESYTRSLGFRPNDVVQKRLAGMGGPVRLGEQATAHPTLQAAVQEGADLWDCKVLPKGEGTEDEGCKYSQDDEKVLEDGGLDRVQIVHITGSAGPGGSVDAMLLIVQEKEKWYFAGIVADSWVPGAFYIHNEGKVDDFSATDAFPSAPGTEVVIVGHTDNSDDDPGISETSETHDAQWRLCGVFGGQPACIQFAMSHRSESWVLKDDGDSGKSLGKSECSFKITMVGGKVLIETGANTNANRLTAEQRACLGAFTPEELMTKPCVEVLTF